MNIHELRAQVGQEEFDYVLAKSALSNLRYPRGAIHRFLQAKELIRVKKGLYIFGKSAAQSPYHPEILANLIYGPSAISLEYALSYYGLIPERVYVITSITNRRNKHFSTPIGEFDYRYLSPEKYWVGITRLEAASGHFFLMATPEKALSDILLFSKDIFLENQTQLEHYLIEDLRVDLSQLKSFDLPLIAEIEKTYRNIRVTLFLNYLRQVIKR